MGQQLKMQMDAASHFATVIKITLKCRRDIKEYFKTSQIFIILEGKQVLVDQIFFPSEILYDKPLSENHRDQNID